jgi:hypothetical protein
MAGHLASLGRYSTDPRKRVHGPYRPAYVCRTGGPVLVGEVEVADCRYGGRMSMFMIDMTDSGTSSILRAMMGDAAIRPRHVP